MTQPKVINIIEIVLTCFVVLGQEGFSCNGE